MRIKFTVLMTSLALVLTLLMAMAPTPTVTAETTTVAPATPEVTGPRVDEWYIIMYASPDAEVIALKRGEVHMVEWPLRPEHIEDLSKMPEEVKLYSAPAFELFHLGVACFRYPFNISTFRFALNFIVDRDWIESELLKGYGVAFASPVPPSYGAWHNPAAEELVWYDPAKADEIFNKLGFVKDPATGKRIDPKTGEPLRPIIFYVRSDDPIRKTIGERLAEELRNLGFDVDVKYCDPYGAWINVYWGEEWDLYTAGWLLGRDVDFLYWFFHSDIERPYNFVLHKNATIDPLLETIVYDPDYEDVFEAVQEAQVLLVQSSPYINLYIRTMVHAARAEWEGFIPMYGYGIENGWTYLNVRPAGRVMGGSFRLAVLHLPMDWNWLTAEWYWDWMVLGPLVEGAPFAVHPYTLEDFPWMGNWTTEVVTGPAYGLPSGVNGTRLVFNLDTLADPGWYYHDGIRVTIDDFVWTYLFLNETKPPRYEMTWWGLVHVGKLNETAIELVYNYTSYWLLHSASMFPLTPHVWKYVKPAGIDPLTFDPMDPDDCEAVLSAMEAAGAPEYDNVTRFYDTYGHLLIGNGPWILAEYAPGSYVKLVPFRKYPFDYTAWEQFEVFKALSIVGTEYPGMIYQGGDVSIKVQVYIDTEPAEDATVKCRIYDPAGRLVNETLMTYTGEGWYEYTIPGEITSTWSPGTWSFVVEALHPEAGMPISTTLSVAVLPALPPVVSPEEFTTTMDEVMDSLEDLSTDVGDVSSRVDTVASAVEGLKGYLSTVLAVAAVAMVIGIVDAILIIVRTRKA